MYGYEYLRCFKVIKRRNGYSILMSANGCFKFVRPDNFDDEELQILDKEGVFWYKNSEGKIVRRYLKSRERFKKTGTRKRGRPRKRKGL